MEKIQQKSQRPIENPGAMLRTLENKTISVEFVKDKVAYSAQFPWPHMVIHRGQASGYACLRFGEELKTVRLTLQSDVSFELAVVSGEKVECFFERSFARRRKRWSIGFYVVALRTIEASVTSTRQKTGASFCLCL